MKKTYKTCGLCAKTVFPPCKYHYEEEMIKGGKMNLEEEIKFKSKMMTILGCYEPELYQFFKDEISQAIQEERKRIVKEVEKLPTVYALRINGAESEGSHLNKIDVLQAIEGSKK